MLLDIVMQKIFLDDKVCDLKSLCENVLKSSQSAFALGNSDEVRINLYLYSLLQYINLQLIRSSFYCKR